MYVLFNHGLRGCCTRKKGPFSKTDMLKLERFDHMDKKKPSEGHFYSRMRQRSSCFAPLNEVQRKTVVSVKHGDGSVMLWSCFAADGIMKKPQNSSASEVWLWLDAKESKKSFLWEGFGRELASGWDLACDHVCEEMEVSWSSATNRSITTWNL